MKKIKEAEIEAPKELVIIKVGNDHHPAEKGDIDEVKRLIKDAIKNNETHIVTNKPIEIIYTPISI